MTCCWFVTMFVKFCTIFFSSCILFLLFHFGSSARNADWRQSPSGLVNACMAKVFCDMAKIKGSSRLTHANFVLCRSLRQFSHVRSEQFKIGTSITACLCHHGSVPAVQTGKVMQNWYIYFALSIAYFYFPVYDCFIIASLESCNLNEFQALVFNITSDALSLQKSNCSRYKYHSDTCAMFSKSDHLRSTLVILLSCFLLIVLVQ